MKVFNRANGLLMTLSLIASSQMLESKSLAQDVVNPNSAVAENLGRATIGERIMREIGRLEVHSGVRLAEGEIFEGVNAAVRYRYELEPSYKGDYHLRMDRWQIDVNLNPGDLLGDFDMSPVGLGIRKGTEILFVRPFKSKWDSAKALPYTPERLPFSAKRALSKLEVGDFVSFTSKLNLVIGASTSGGSFNVPASAATHYMVTGEFQIHVFKATDKKVRMKLIGLRRRGVGASARAGFSSDLFKVTGLRIVNRRIERMFDATEIFKLDMAKTQANLLMVDYMLDLTDPSVAQAYDNVMTSVLKFKVVGLPSPFKTDAALTSQLISDVTPIENIFAEQKVRREEDRLVNRLFKGKNDIGDQFDSSIRFGVLLFKLGQESQYIENALTSVDENENKTFFKLHTFQRRNIQSAFFSYWKSESLSRASVLFGADQNLAIQDIRDIVFEWEYRDKKLSGGEIQDIQSTLQRNVPMAVYRKIPWGVWGSGKDRVNARALMTSVLHPDAYRLFENLSQQEILESLKRYLLSVPQPSAPTADPFARIGGGETFTSFHNVTDRYAYDLNTISELLWQVFSVRTATAEQRAKAFSNLRNSDLFVEIGPGFLVSMLPPADIEKYLFLRVSLTADKTPPLNFEYGLLRDRKMYDAAAYIQAILGNRDVDMAIQLAR